MNVCRWSAPTALPPTNSQQPCELINGQPGLTNDGPQGSFRDFRMVGHGHATMRRRILTQDHVAAALSIQLITDLALRSALTTSLPDTTGSPLTERPPPPPP